MVSIYGASLVFGYLLEKYLRIPWMFAALFFGLGLAATGLFKSTIESEVFLTLESMGMLLLLFLIGFNLDFKKIAGMKRYVAAGALSIVGFEALFVSLVLFFSISRSCRPFIRCSLDYWFVLRNRRRGCAASYSCRV